MKTTSRRRPSTCVCYKCHAEKQGPFAIEHPPVRENCTICHEPHGTVTNNLLRQPATFLCLRCHAGHNGLHPPGGVSLQLKLNTGSGPQGIAQPLYTDCTQCHAANPRYGSHLPTRGCFLYSLANQPRPRPENSADRHRGELMTRPALNLRRDGAAFASRVELGRRRPRTSILPARPPPIRCLETFRLAPTAIRCCSASRNAIRSGTRGSVGGRCGIAVRREGRRIPRPELLAVLGRGRALQRRHQNARRHGHRHRPGNHRGQASLLPAGPERRGRLRSLPAPTRSRSAEQHGPDQRLAGESFHDEPEIHRAGSRRRPRLRRAGAGSQGVLQRRYLRQPQGPPGRVGNGERTESAKSTASACATAKPRPSRPTILRSTLSRAADATCSASRSRSTGPRARSSR